MIVLVARRLLWWQEFNNVCKQGTKYIEIVIQNIIEIMILRRIEPVEYNEQLSIHSMHDNHDVI